jgi:hypothetical protein
VAHQKFRTSIPGTISVTQTIDRGSSFERPKNVVYEKYDMARASGLIAPVAARDGLS